MLETSYGTKHGHELAECGLLEQNYIVKHHVSRYFDVMYRISPYMLRKLRDTAFKIIGEDDVRLILCVMGNPNADAIYMFVHGTFDKEIPKTARLGLYSEINS